MEKEKDKIDTPCFSRIDSGVRTVDYTVDNQDWSRGDWKLSAAGFALIGCELQMVCT